MTATLSSKMEKPDLVRALWNVWWNMVNHITRDVIVRMSKRYVACHSGAEGFPWHQNVEMFRNAQSHKCTVDMPSILKACVQGNNFRCDTAMRDPRNWNKGLWSECTEYSAWCRFWILVDASWNNPSQKSAILFPTKTVLSVMFLCGWYNLFNRANILSQGFLPNTHMLIQPAHKQVPVLRYCWNLQVTLDDHPCKAFPPAPRLTPLFSDNITTQNTPKPVI